MKRKPILSEASVVDTLESFAEFGLIRKVFRPSPAVGMTDSHRRRHLADVRTLAQRYTQARDMQRIPLDLASGATIRLSAGGQNVLIQRIINDFCPRFTPGAKPVYVGDADKKWAYFDPDYLRSLGVAVDEHGKMPDVVVHFTKRNWLVLIEAVTSHGPVNPKRLTELKSLFAGQGGARVGDGFSQSQRATEISRRNRLGDRGLGSRYARPHDSLQRRAFPWPLLIDKQLAAG